MTEEKSTESEYTDQPPLTVIPKRLPSDRIFGFRMEWLTGEGADDGAPVTFRLDHNAGMGGADLMISVERDGKHVQESIDIRPLVSAWVNQIIASMKAAG